MNKWFVLCTVILSLLGISPAAQAAQDMPISNETNATATPPVSVPAVSPTVTKPSSRAIHVKAMVREDEEQIVETVVIRTIRFKKKVPASCLPAGYTLVKPTASTVVQETIEADDENAATTDIADASHKPQISIQPAPEKPSFIISDHAIRSNRRDRTADIRNLIELTPDNRISIGEVSYQLNKDETPGLAVFNPFEAPAEKPAAPKTEVPTTQATVFIGPPAPGKAPQLPPVHQMTDVNEILKQQERERQIAEKAAADAYQKMAQLSIASVASPFNSFEYASAPNLTQELTQKITDGEPEQQEHRQGAFGSIGGNGKPPIPPIPPQKQEPVPWYKRLLQQATAWLSAQVSGPDGLWVIGALAIIAGLVAMCLATWLSKRRGLKRKTPEVAEPRMLLKGADADPQPSRAKTVIAEGEDRETYNCTPRRQALDPNSEEFKKKLKADQDLRRKVWEEQGRLPFLLQTGRPERVPGQRPIPNKS